MSQTIRWHNLHNGIAVAVDDLTRFTTDSVLLSHFANPKPREAACDFCSGSGIIPLLWQKQNPPKTLCLELSASAVLLLNQTIEHNQLGTTLTALQGDLRHLGEKQIGRFHLITCNPPYFLKEAGKLGKREQASHELTCTLEDVAQAAQRLLHFGGRLCLCQRVQRLTDVLVTMRTHNLEPKRLQLVAHRECAAPYLLLLECKKGAAPGLNLLPTLVLEQNGVPSPAYRAIYHLDI